MGQFPRAKPSKGAPRKAKILPPVTVHVFVPSGSMTAAVIPQEICQQCGNPRNHRIHDRREPSEIYTEVDRRRIGESKPSEAG